MQIKAIKTFLLKDFMDSPTMLGRVHSVFEHAINLNLDETLLTVLPDIDVGVPDSIEISRKDFMSLKHIRTQESVFLKDKKIIIGETEIRFSNSPNMENTFSISTLASKQEMENRKKLFGFYHTLSERAEVKFTELLIAIKNNDKNSCEKILKSLIGLGSGLTPSADDALIGISAVIEFLSKCGIETFDNFAMLLYDMSKNSTTDVSRKYFRCAMQKRFSIPLINVVRSLFENDFKFDFSALAKLLNAGHSSGKDTMRGIILAQTLF